MPSAVHDVGRLLYYDGANLNAIVGAVRPGVMGFDVVHMNLHKTFATPHGGGGPGAGPVAVSSRRVSFLPGPKAASLADGSLRMGGAANIRSGEFTVGTATRWSSREPWPTSRSRWRRTYARVHNHAVLERQLVTPSSRDDIAAAYDRCACTRVAVKATEARRRSTVARAGRGQSGYWKKASTANGVLPAHCRRGVDVPNRPRPRASSTSKLSLRPSSASLSGLTTIPSLCIGRHRARRSRALTKPAPHDTSSPRPTLNAKADA